MSLIASKIDDGALQATSGTPSWAFNPDNATAVAGWGFWLAIIGMVLTILGFGITIVQLKRTKIAAKAAEDEAKRIQVSLNRYEVTNELAKATVSLNTARNYVRNGLWINVADNYETVRSALEALKEDTLYLNDDLRAKINSASIYIQNLCSRIERDHAKGAYNIDSAKTLSVAAEHNLLLLEITRIVEKGVVQ